MQKEPLITVASITAAVSAVLALLVVFGIDVTEAQTAGIMGVVAVVAPLVVAWAARGKVTSPATVAAIRAKAAEPPH